MANVSEEENEVHGILWGMLPLRNQMLVESSNNRLIDLLHNKNASGS
jgi:hypothetical protein